MPGDFGWALHDTRATFRGREEAVNLTVEHLMDPSRHIPRNARLARCKAVGRGRVDTERLVEAMEEYNARQLRTSESVFVDSGDAMGLCVVTDHSVGI